MARIDTPIRNKRYNNSAGLASDLSDETGSDGGFARATAPEFTSPTFIGTLDGRIGANETWTYASATTITVPAGAASKYIKGDFIQITQTTNKWFYITAVADTLLTVTGGSDYTVANAAITNPYYSHHPFVGHPIWFNYVPATIVGWTTPTVSSALFKLDGRWLTIQIKITGTSDSTSTSFTCPDVTNLRAQYDTESLGAVWNINSGTVSTTPGRARIFSNSGTITVFRDYATTAWTAIGTKQIVLIAKYATQ